MTISFDISTRDGVMSITEIHSVQNQEPVLHDYNEQTTDRSYITASTSWPMRFPLGTKFWGHKSNPTNPTLYSSWDIWAQLPRRNQ